MDKQAFQKKLLLKMESMRRPSGAFIAAPTDDYRACWLRDHLYTVFSYWFLGDHNKLIEGVQIVFDILHMHRHKLERVSHRNNVYEYIHAKHDADTFAEVTDKWGHYQLDALGFFLHIVADLDSKHITVMRNYSDREILQLLVMYLLSVRYWENPDFGMWEETSYLHASSIGAVVDGLTRCKERQLAVIPEEMIQLGRQAMNRLLPDEFPGRDADMALLSLIWPYNIVTSDVRDIILQRTRDKLVQEHGLNRYWGDNYFRSANGISGEWVMGFFWLSIIASQMNNVEEAQKWFAKGVAQITRKGEVPELYQDGKPNKHTPLAWAHALVLIALSKLELKRKQLSFILPDISEE